MKSNQRFALHEYVNAGCMQLEGSAYAIGVALYSVTGGTMCDGCPAYNSGKCESYKKISARYRDPVIKPVPGGYVETVRDEAKRRGISIKQVRMERRDG